MKFFRARAWFSENRCALTNNLFLLVWIFIAELDSLYQMTLSLNDTSCYVTENNVEQSPDPVGYSLTASILISSNLQNFSLLNSRKLSSVLSYFALFSIGEVIFLTADMPVLNICGKIYSTIFI